MSTTLYHVRISLADVEYGNVIMQRVAREFCESRPDIADSLVVEVYEHGGWFLEFLRDGTTVGTANDGAVFQGKGKEFRDKCRQPDVKWERLPEIRRQYLVDEGKLVPYKE